MTLAEEKQLLRNYQAGLVSEEELLAEYKSLIKFFIFKRVRYCIAEDCYQESCLELFKIAKRYNPEASDCKFSSYLLEGLKQSVIRTFNRRQYKYERRNVSLDTMINEKNFDIAAKEEEELAEFTVRFRSAIHSLTELEKKIIILDFFEDKQHKEIAQILSIPAGSVSYYQKRALKKLKEALTIDYDEILAGV